MTIILCHVVDDTFILFCWSEIAIKFLIFFIKKGITDQWYHINKMK
jgi:hypothetical protein